VIDLRVDTTLYNHSSLDSFAKATVAWEPVVLFSEKIITFLMSPFAPLKSLRQGVFFKKKQTSWVVKDLHNTASDVEDFNHG